MIETYRKVPVTIEAVLYDGSNFGELYRFTQGWFKEAFESGSRIPTRSDVYDRLHDTWVRVNIGDYVIKGVAGEFYPCNPDVFNATYEVV